MNPHLAKININIYVSKAGLSTNNRCTAIMLSRPVIFVCLHFVVPMGIFPMGNLGSFPHGKPDAAESRYPTLINYKVHMLGLFMFL